MVAPHPVSAAAPRPPPLVGRGREQMMLRAALAAALAGRGALVLIGGEAGIGKTTLAEALCAEAEGQGALVLVGRCYDLSETPPYGPWRGAFARAPRDAALPVLPAAVLAGEQGGEEFASQEAIFARVRDYLAALAMHRPLVILLDDLHWADPATLDLLRFAGRDLAAVPILLLVTYRSDEITRRHPLYALLPILVREARVERLDLHRLVVDDLRALIRGRYGLPDAEAERLVGYIGARADGNPFYTGELLRMLEGARVLRPHGDRWALGALTAVGVPPLLRQVIDARADQLGQAARGLLVLAAVIGQAVPLNLWADVAEVREEALADPIERAVAAGLLLLDDDGAAVRFAHALIREALYAGTLPVRRRAWHRRAAEALASSAAPDPDAVADHFQQAGDPRAVTWLERAGARAQRAYAWGSAAARYEAVLALLEQQAAPPLARARVAHTLAQLLRYTDRHRAIALLAEATALAIAGDDPVLVAAARFDRGLLLCIDGDNYAAGLPEVRATLPALEALSPDQFAALPTAAVLGLRPDENYHRGVYILALVASGHLAEAVAAGALETGTSTSSPFQSAVGLLHLLRGEPAAAARVLATAAAAARAGGQHRDAANKLRYLAEHHHWYGADDLPARAAIGVEVAATLPAARDADPDVTATEFLYSLRLVEGAWDELARWEEAHPHRSRAFYALPARLRGDVVGARVRVRAVLPGGPATEPGTCFIMHALPEQRAAADVALDTGDLPEARTWLLAHDRWLAWSGAVWGRAEGHLGWAAYHRAAGDPARARQHAAAALAQASEPRQPLALLAAHRLLGELDTDAGRHADAARHLDAALALAEACAAPYERALTLLAQAELRAAHGDQAGARGLLAEVCAICTPLDAAPALARAGALAARLAATVVTPPPYPAGLTPREVDVLRLLAGGASNRAIADALFLSPHTVERHIANLYAKTDAHSRAEATAFARRHRLA